MSEPYRPLAQTLARIEELIANAGRPRNDVLNVRQLSLATGVVEADVELMLAGGTPADEDPDAVVRQRVRFLYEHHTGPDNRPRDIREIATAIDQTPTWTKKLTAGEAKPSLVTGSRLTRFYGVAPTFLTDLPAEALDRELQKILFDLEVEADPGKTLKDMGVLHMSGRSSAMDNPDLAALAKMVADITSDLNRVKGVVDRLVDPEAPQ